MRRIVVAVRTILHPSMMRMLLLLLSDHVYVDTHRVQQEYRHPCGAYEYEMVPSSMMMMMIPVPSLVVSLLSHDAYLKCHVPAYGSVSREVSDYLKWKSNADPDVRWWLVDEMGERGMAKAKVQ